MKVVDLFCGAGGLSEGFRQAGFEMVFALDKDRWAAETHRKNHTDTQVVQADIRKFPLDQLPECDVLIGGPPCIEFSSSKRGGNGNVLNGLLLVQAFLRAVWYLQPRFWVMENVPRITRFLPERVPLTWFGVPGKGSLHVARRGIFNTADYGVPQTRRRFLMGKFPSPKATHHDSTAEETLLASSQESPWRTLGEALASLPNPLGPTPDGDVLDFNYGFQLDASQLTDHFYDTRLAADEARRIRKSKVAHPFYGMMKFPDELDRPARTIVATQLGRETLVLPVTGPQADGFRRATVRECALLQTFPITYQFWGSLAARYRLAGDAVPPRLGFSIARAILEECGLPTPSKPRVTEEVTSPSPVAPIRVSRRSPARFDTQRKFVELVPGKEIRGCRAELDNRGGTPVRVVTEPRLLHPCRWAGRLHVGEGRLRTQTIVDPDRVLSRMTDARIEATYLDRLDQFLEAADERLHGKVPDATTLQAAWCRVVSDTLGPLELSDQLGKLVDEFFPRQRFHEVVLPRRGDGDLGPPRGLRVRIAAGLLLAAYAAELANHDPCWIIANEDKRFRPPDWPSRSDQAKATDVSTLGERLGRTVAGSMS